MKFLFLLGGVLVISAAPAPDVGSNVFSAGTEYTFDVNIFSQAGNDDFVGFASTFNITGELQAGSTMNINVRLINQDGEYIDQPASEVAQNTSSTNLTTENATSNGGTTLSPVTIAPTILPPITG